MEQSPLLNGEKCAGGAIRQFLSTEKKVGK